MNLDEVGIIMDLALLETYRQDQKPQNINQLEETTKMPRVLITKAKLLNVWFELEAPGNHIIAVADGLYNSAINQLVDFLVDPATGVATNPLICKNKFVLPLLAKNKQMWDDDGLSEIEKERFRVRCEMENLELSKKLEIHSTSQEINIHLLAGLATPQKEIAKIFKKNKISLEKLGKEKSIHKRLKALRILREIREEELRTIIEARLEPESEQNNQLVKLDGDRCGSTIARVCGSAKFEHRNIQIVSDNIHEENLPDAMRKCWENSWIELLKFNPTKVSETIQLLATRRRRFNAALSTTISNQLEPGMRQMCQFQKMTKAGHAAPCFSEAEEGKKFCEVHGNHKGKFLNIIIRT